MSQYWYTTCSRCEQGRLFIMKRNDADELHVHCEECEWAWNTPEDVPVVEKGFLGMDLDSRFATKLEIDGAGWSQYAQEEVAE